MREPDHYRKYAAVLIGVAVVVCAAVLVSWWLPATATTHSDCSASVASSTSPETSPPPTLAAAPAPEESPRAAPAPKPVVPASGPSASEEALARKAFQLEMDNARLRGRLEDMLNWIVANLKGTFPLPDNQIANLRLLPMDESLEGVSEDLIRLLRLNDTEIDSLDTAFIGTHTLLRDLEEAGIAVESPSPNQVVLNIPAFADEGHEAREELYAELKRALGTPRFNLLLQVAEDGLDEQFENFGDQERILEFEALTDPAGGGEQLFVRDERARPSKKDPFRVDLTTSERIVTELPPEYYTYLHWLPASIMRFARSH